MRSGPVVQLNEVRKAFRDGVSAHEVLHGVSLDVHAGEVVALLGPSGSGKSTLLNVIAGLDAADAGTIRVAGRELGRLNERERTLLRRREIGFVFQFFNLVPTLTVLENVQLPLQLTRADVASAAALLQRVGLAGRERGFPDELSGGEQQRVAIARAVAHRPRLLLADEPTGNLDSATGRDILDLLVELAAHHGMAMLIATHSADVVARADRVLVLHDGAVSSTS